MGMLPLMCGASTRVQVGDKLTSRNCEMICAAVWIRGAKSVAQTMQWALYHVLRHNIHILLYLQTTHFM